MPANVSCLLRFVSTVFLLETEVCVAPQTRKGCASRCKQEGSRLAKWGRLELIIQCGQLSVAKQSGSLDAI